MKAILYIDVWSHTDCKTSFPTVYFPGQMPEIAGGQKRYLIKFELPDPVIDGVIKAEVEPVEEIKEIKQ